MNVRLLDATEWELFRSVRLAALNDAPHAFGATAEEEARYPASWWSQRITDRVQFLADDGGVACETCGLLDEGDPLAEIVGLWVAPDWRGRGVGDALVAAAIDAARVAGSKHIKLWVTDGNDPASRLYEQTGFSWTGHSQPVTEGEDGTESAMSLSPR